MEAAEHSDLSNRFFEYFEILPADSEALRQEAFKIRYEAFFNCLRLQTEDHPNSQEKDAYDADALHSLLYHRPSGVYAGTLRLIVPKPNDDAWRFHIERVAGRHFYNPVMPSSLATRPAIGRFPGFACLDSSASGKANGIGRKACRTWHHRRRLPANGARCPTRYSAW
ncbi:GNAT family N-acyltransferase [Methylogaea oryzae]|uniref:GNAT family N-acyltransferase n=1 Tax=Methylogaea oryzae TaxID=1295382 RepID=UPI0006CF6C6F|nr:GNAT family N-acyltransferase [Methylogaea oryzae]